MATEKFVDFCLDNKISLKQNVPMCEHTSFKIGGNADLFVTPQSTEELSAVLECLKNEKIPCFILGKGSNLIVSDKGIEGAVISLQRLDKISVFGDTIIASAGASLAAVCVVAMQNGLSGLEFAYGIPGSVGGAIYMNAGAYGGEMSQVVLSAKGINLCGNIVDIPLSEMQLGYRTSIFKQNGMVVTEITFKLEKGDSAEIQAKMEDYMGRRRDKQPLQYPSAGSTFKRPEGYFAGALIEKNGLKGARVGGAMVSEKHAGFVINYENATAEDVLTLMKNVQQKVFEADGVKLEPEIIFVGRK